MQIAGLQYHLTMPNKDTSSRENELPALSTEEEIEQMAACGMVNSEMALILGVSKKEFNKQANTPDTKYFNAIKKGKLWSELQVSQALQRLAEVGNITGVQQFEKRLKAKRLQQLKERIYYAE